MESLSTELLTATLALVGVVIVITALLSGLIERSGLPQVGVFLALGAVIGPAGLNLLDITLESPILRVVATLSLLLVLFTDAVSLNIADARSHKALALLVLGPGTILSAVLAALAARWLLGLAPAAAAILGASLASTDPVLLRGLLRRHDLPRAVFQALRLESGLNDAVLLPVVLVAMVIFSQQSPVAASNWATLGLDLFLLGPGAGVAVGLLGVSTLEMVRRRIGVRRDYESLYSLGIAFAAYAAAEAVHGSGFLAAFTAGLTISALVELCDCFLEYGETTAEMALLFTFVLLGSSLIWSGFKMLSGPTILFALCVLLARPVAFLLSLAGTRLDWRSRLLIAWFGPRGLSSLLLVLLPVFAGQVGSERLFSLCCLVVVLSVALHGGSLMLLGRGDQTFEQTKADAKFLPSSSSLPVGVKTEADSEASNPVVSDSQRISVEEMQRLQRSGTPVVVLDVRTDRSYEGSDLEPKGAVRLRPERVVEGATRLGLPPKAWLVALCA